MRQVVYLGGNPRNQVLRNRERDMEKRRKATIYVIIEVVTDGKEDQILLRSLGNMKLVMIHRSSFPSELPCPQADGWF